MPTSVPLEKLGARATGFRTGATFHGRDAPGRLTAGLVRSSDYAPVHHREIASLKEGIAPESASAHQIGYVILSFSLIAGGAGLNMCRNQKTDRKNFAAQRTFRRLSAS